MKIRLGSLVGLEFDAGGVWLVPALSSLSSICAWLVGSGTAWTVDTTTPSFFRTKPPLGNPLGSAFSKVYSGAACTLVTLSRVWCSSSMEKWSSVGCNAE